MLKNVPGIEKVTLTTNGVLLEQYLGELLNAGLDAVNISLDTLDPGLYETITGADALDKVLGIISRADRLPIPVTVSYTHLDVYKRQVIWLLNRLYSLNPCDPFLYSHISYRFCNYVGYRLV